MKEFVCLTMLDHPMESELLRNALEAAGIPSTVSLERGGGCARYGIFVHQRDLSRAREFLEGAGEGTNAVSAQEASAQQLERDAAEREFRELRREELEAKAEGVRAAAVTAGLSLLLGAAVFFFFPDPSIGIRVALACLLLAVIQFFIWKDGRDAREKIRKMDSST